MAISLPGQLHGMSCQRPLLHQQRVVCARVNGPAHRLHIQPKPLAHRQFRSVRLPSAQRLIIHMRPLVTAGARGSKSGSGSGGGGSRSQGGWLSQWLSRVMGGADKASTQGGPLMDTGKGAGGKINRSNGGNNGSGKIGAEMASAPSKSGEAWFPCSRLFSCLAARSVVFVPHCSLRLRLATLNQPNSGCYSSAVCQFDKYVGSRAISPHGCCLCMPT